MFQIVKKRQLAERIYLMDIHAPRVARSCYPGQFVILKIDEKGERIPLTICDYDREAGTVAIVFQAVGASTLQLADMEEGESIQDFAGPLGQKSDLIDLDMETLKKMHILFVGGGVGVAPVFPQVKWLYEKGIRVDCIIGARSKNLILFEEPLRQYAEHLYIVTDDGSYGKKGNVNDCIKALIEEDKKSYDRVIAIGPLIMMKFVSLLTKELQIPTVVSMNPIMVDGTGMCGACRLTVGGTTRFACVDGPEFDGHLIDFDEAMNRQTLYRTEEGRAMLRLKEGDSHHGGCGYCEEKGAGPNG